jgi:hypothetical protein
MVAVVPTTPWPTPRRYMLCGVAIKGPTPVAYWCINKIALIMKFETAVIANGSLTRVSPQLDPSQYREPAAALEAFTRNELDDDQLITALLRCCHADSNKRRQAQSLLDQYHRRGLLETGVFLAAKTELSFVAIISEPPHLVGAADPPAAMTALDQFSRGMFDTAPR